MSATIIGVMGPSLCDEATFEKARTVGRLLAAAGYTVLCGGGTGVMEGVARGAAEAGGLTLGILPGSNAQETPPNPYIHIPIFTGLSHARNLINVLSSRVVVAIGGAHGTLSEIALALKSGKPVVLLDSWRFESPSPESETRPIRVASPEKVLAEVNRIVRETG